MKCKICSQNTEKIFSHRLLEKYNVEYYKCYHCLFVQTEEPYWLEEAYSLGAIGALDVGIMHRNMLLKERTAIIIQSIFLNLSNFIGLDYGGGQGIYVRLMRDLGFNFYRQDLYANNLYARYFDIKDLTKGTKFNILTAFEVFEHLPNPIDEIKKMFDFSDVLLFSTELQPSVKDIELKDWWYIVPEGGQHVSFYTERTLEEIARIFGSNYYTDGKNLHILSKSPLITNPFVTKQVNKSLFNRFIGKLYHKMNSDKLSITNKRKEQSLILKDFEFVKLKIKENEN